MAKLLTVLLICLMFGSLVWAQPNGPNSVKSDEPVVGLTAEDARTFSTALKALAKAGHCACIAEGTPLVAQLDESHAKNLTADHLPLSEMISRLAAAFDYDALQRKGIFVLKKRYTNPKDLPDVTLEECRQSLRDVVRLVKPHIPDEKMPGDILQGVLGGFSPAELQQMQNRGIPVAQLTAPQRTLLERLVLHAYLMAPMEFAKQSLKILDHERAIVFVRKPWSDDLKETRTPAGFEWPGETFWPVDVVEGRRVKVDYATLPGDSVPAGETLGALAASLNEKAGRDRFVVDSLLSDRPITIAGREFAEAATLFEALGVLEDLTIIEAQGKSALRRRVVYVPQDFRQMPAVVRRALPSPVLRALHEPAGGQRPPEDSEDPIAVMTSDTIRRVNLKVEPLLEKSGEPVALARLSSSTRSAFALRALCDYYLHWIRNQLRPEPPLYLAHFEESTLRLDSGSLRLEVQGSMLIGFGFPPKGSQSAPGAGN